MKQLVENLEKWNFRVCAVFLIDAQFLVDTPKFFSGVLAALSVMVTLETSHVNIMSKVDLLDKNDKNELQKYLRKKFFFFNLILILLNIKRYLEPDLDLLNDDNESLIYRKKFHKLNNQFLACLIFLFYPKSILKTFLFTLGTFPYLKSNKYMNT